MKISLGNSRFEKKWRVLDLTLADFVKKISQTTVTAETMAEYLKMSKMEQDTIKDVGGFVLGELKDGRRKKENVISRSGLTLDMDFALPGTIDEIEMLSDFKAYVYSTHKHTAEKPRLRLIIPLKRDVDTDEYQAIARRVAKDIGIEMFDDTTYEPSRLMYWPSTCADGEFVFKELKGNILDPDVVLKRYADWTDASQWPVSQRQHQIVNKALKKQEDPTKKDGIVGAFCRSYSIENAIDAFLSDVYKPSAMKGRYDYIGGTTQAGLVIYEDMFAYSHHGSDPAGGQLLNAFDLVRVHKFGELDENAKEGERPPSFNAMCEFASKDEDVKVQMAEDRLKQASEEFKVDVNWLSKLDTDKFGRIKETVQNIVSILKNDDRLQGISYNLHSDNVEATGKLPWKQIKRGWGDADFANLKVYLSQYYGIYSPQKVKDALVAVATSRAFHPIKEYLEELPQWDGVERVEALLRDYLGADDSEYTKAITRKTLVAAIARVYKPGIKFDNVLILNGPQGIGKSLLFNRLGGRWFSDALTLTDMRDKAGAEKLQGYWILELGELAGMRKTDVETVKSFITREDDKYRVAYGVYVESHQRQCIIVGSTNAETGFLRDVSGNRRFWPVRVTGECDKKPWDLEKSDIAQLWAEAKIYYEKGEKLYLDKNLKALAEEQQAEAMEEDDREGIVREYLARRLPKDWEDKSLYERRQYLNDDFGAINDTEEREFVCNLEIWSECFGRDPAAMEKQDSYQISAILKKINEWGTYEGVRGGLKYFKIYGRQRAWVKKPVEQQ